MFQSGFLTTKSSWATLHHYYKHKAAIWKMTSTLTQLNRVIRSFSTSSDDTRKGDSTVEKDLNDLTFSIAKKYQIFHDHDSSIILDIEEERELRSLETELSPFEKAGIAVDEFSGLNLKRGLRGVYDIEELVEVLRRDKAQDIFVASLRSELKYVDFIVVVSGKSPRHMLAMAEFVRKVFKKKKGHMDIIPRIEGENSKDWIALDLGNIALHIFSKGARKLYDLDSLWGVGIEYDDLCNKPEDPLIALIEKHSVYLGDLLPKETNG